jgi:hypothetical protein
LADCQRSTSGTIEAKDANAAVEVAAKEFNADPKRLIAVRRA